MLTQWIQSIMDLLIDSLCENGLLRLQFKVATSQGCMQLLCVTCLFADLFHVLFRGLYAKREDLCRTLL